MTMKTRLLLIPVLALCVVFPASADLTRRWALNEPTLDFGIVESVSGSNSAVLFGTTTGVVGNPGVDANDLAYLFNGVGNGVSTGLTNVLPASGPFGVFVTARFPTNYTGGARMLLSNNNAQAGRIDFGIDGAAATPNKLTFFLGGSPNLSLAFTDSTSTPVLFDGNFHEVGITRTGTTYQLYVDGVAKGTSSTSSTTISSNVNYLIGRRTAYSGFFNNLITEVQVFNDFRTTGVPLLPADSDADSLPDYFEILYFILPGENPGTDAATIVARHTSTDDPDGDGLANLVEFHAGTNPALADTDNDGLLDTVETKTGTWVSSADTGTSPTKPDSDGDGLLDGQETNTGTYVSPTDTGTNPNLADTDGDTYADYLEIARSSDPTSNTSTPGTSSLEPLVEVGTDSLTDGELASWPNTGTLGRSFEADSPPSVETIGGVRGVTFTGTQVLTGPVAPSNLTGASPRTIQAWIFNPTTSTEETIVAWGRRDGPNGTLCAFFHGSNASFGAVGNWGTPDMPWGTDAAAIANNVKLGSWTYVVYTYDGTEGRLYSNGTVAYTEVLNALATFGVDNTSAARPLPIRIAGQNAANGTLATAGQKGSLTIAKLRIHDRVVAAADLGFNDSDSDGMKDWYEEFYGLNPTSDDSADDPDIDGLTNLQEQAGGTHPTNADTDGDGLPDGWEVTYFGNQTSGAGDDPDGDGATNLMEFQATNSLTIQRDLGGAVTGTTPVAGSSDPTDADSQPDEDHDTLPDGWEQDLLGGLSSGPTDDPDADTFDNLTEFTAGSDPSNQRSTPTDVDGDGLADAWETTYFITITAQDGTGDPDGDGATNEMEETGGSLPNDPDSQPDNDADGLPDGYEMVRFGNLDQDNTTDFDGDGFTDLAEFTAGSNPTRVGNTPENVHSTVRVAIATNGGLDEYSVKDNVWTKVRPISSGAVSSVTFHLGALYATTDNQVVRIDPVSGLRTVLFTRNLGEALAAGWTASRGDDLTPGPDGKMYFGTTFGTPNGEGIFRFNPDGTGFERFVARNGGTAPDTWELYNCIGLAWKGSELYATARGAWDATGRPIYKFDSTGAFLGAFANNLQGPQGLLLDGDHLVVTGTNAARALVALDTNAPPPVTTPLYTKTGLATNPDAENILGEIHVINNYNLVGSVMKAGTGPALTTVLTGIGSGVYGNDLVAFTSGPPPATATIAEWKLDETAGTLATATGNPSIDGTLGDRSGGDAPTWAPTEGINGALLFDDDSDRVAAPALNIGSKFTVMGWIKPDSTGASSARFVTSNYSNGFFLGKNSVNDSWTFILQGDLATPPAGGTIAINEWQHVCGTFDGTTAALYVNGVLVDAKPATAPSTPVQAIYLGSESAKEASFTGLYDQVRILDGALDAAAVAAIFASESGGTDPYETWARSYGFDGTTGDGLPEADKDGDGTSNQAEFLLGLVPVDPNSRFAATLLGTPATGLTLTWPSQPGLTFTVKSSTDLAGWPATEATVPADAAPATTTSWSTGPFVPAGKKFFRVELAP